MGWSSVQACSAIVGLASNASFFVLLEASFEVSLGLTDVDLTTSASYFVNIICLFLGWERVFDLSESS